MNKTLLFILLALMPLFSCKKNNTKGTTTTSTTTPAPGYTIEFSISDFELAPQPGKCVQTVKVRYKQAQFISTITTDSVTISLSGLPNGIAVHGLPSIPSPYVGSREFMLNFYDTAMVPATAGTYIIALTFTGRYGITTSNLTVTVSPQSSCVDKVADWYNGYGGCVGSELFVDTVTVDALVMNKIWFKNFGNSGKSVYAICNCATTELKLPAQTVDGITISGAGFLSKTTIDTFFNISVNYHNNDSICSISMTN